MNRYFDSLLKKENTFPLLFGVNLIAIISGIVTYFLELPQIFTFYSAAITIIIYPIFLQNRNQSNKEATPTSHPWWVANKGLIAVMSMMTAIVTLISLVITDDKNINGNNNIGSNVNIGGDISNKKIENLYEDSPNYSIQRDLITLSPGGSGTEIWLHGSSQKYLEGAVCKWKFNPSELIDFKQDKKNSCKGFISVPKDKIESIKIGPNYVELVINVQKDGETYSVRDSIIIVHDIDNPKSIEIIKKNALEIRKKIKESEKK